MRTALRCFSVTLMLFATGWACEFQHDPAALPHYYRADGWQLPGISEFNPSTKSDALGSPTVAQIPGAVFRVLPHEDPYIVSFPAVSFDLNGSGKRMRPLLAKAKILRIEVDGKIVAYTYALIPVWEAHKNSKGEWVIKGEAACIFTATFIDDRGMGFFVFLFPVR